MAGKRFLYVRVYVRIHACMYVRMYTCPVYMYMRTKNASIYKETQASLGML